MRGSITRFKVAAQTVINNEKGTYIPLQVDIRSNYQVATVPPTLRVYSNRDRGPQAESPTAMLVESDVISNVHCLVP